MLFNQGGLFNHGVCPSCGYCPTCGQRRQNGVQMPSGGLQYHQGDGNEWEKKYQEMMQKQSGGKHIGSPHQENT